MCYLYEQRSMSTFMNLEKRVDQIEISLNEVKIELSNHKVLLEKILDFARIQTVVAERSEKRQEQTDLRLEKLIGRQEQTDLRLEKLTSSVEGLTQQVQNLVNYLGNPLKNGHS